MSTDLEEIDMHTLIYIVIVSDAFLQGSEVCTVSMTQNWTLTARPFSHYCWQQSVSPLDFFQREDSLFHLAHISGPPHLPGGSLHKQQDSKQRRVCIIVPWAGPSCKSEIKGQLDLVLIYQNSSVQLLKMSFPALLLRSLMFWFPGKDGVGDVKGE